MPEPLGYYVFSSATRQWLSIEGGWTTSFGMAEEFSELNEANEAMVEHNGDYVFAVMPSP